MMYLALDQLLLGVGFHVVDLRLEGCIRLAVFGTLFCIVSDLPTRETCVAALIVFPDRIGHNVLDLFVGLVGILLPGWFKLKPRLLPGTSLLNWLSILLGLKHAFMIIINWLIIVNQLVFPFCYKGLVYQSLKVG